MLFVWLFLDCIFLQNQHILVINRRGDLKKAGLFDIFQENKMSFCQTVYIFKSHYTGEGATLT